MCQPRQEIKIGRNGARHGGVDDVELLETKQARKRGWYGALETWVRLNNQIHEVCEVAEGLSKGATEIVALQKYEARHMPNRIAGHKLPLAVVYGCV